MLQSGSHRNYDNFLTQKYFLQLVYFSEIMSQNLSYEEIKAHKYSKIMHGAIKRFLEQMSLSRGNAKIEKSPAG